MDHDPVADLGSLGVAEVDLDEGVRSHPAIVARP
jgi:hypothetical protein